MTCRAHGVESAQEVDRSISVQASPEDAGVIRVYMLGWFLRVVMASET